jgi:hypothetical protein
MKYYIFGSNKQKGAMLRFKSMALYEGYDIEESLKVFKSMVDEVRKTRLVLIADFGYGIDSDQTNDLDSFLPYLVVAEWRGGEDRSIDSLIRKDKIKFTLQPNPNKFGYGIEWGNNADLCKHVEVAYRLKQRFSVTIQYTKEDKFEYSGEDYIDDDKLDIERKFERFLISDSANPRHYKFFFKVVEPDWDILPVNNRISPKIVEKKYKTAT